MEMADDDKHPLLVIGGFIGAPAIGYLVGRAIDDSFGVMLGGIAWVLLGLYLLFHDQTLLGLVPLLAGAVFAIGGLVEFLDFLSRPPFQVPTERPSQLPTLRPPFTLSP
jgi:hypothetical protein